MKKRRFNGRDFLFLLCITVLSGWAINETIDQYECQQAYGDACSKMGKSDSGYTKEGLKKARQINEMINSINN